VIQSTFEKGGAKSVATESVVTESVVTESVVTDKLSLCPTKNDYFCQFNKNNILLLTIEIERI